MNKIVVSFFWVMGIFVLTINHTLAKNSLDVDIHGKLQKAKTLYNKRENCDNLKSAVGVYKNIVEQLPHQEMYNSTRAEVLIELSKCYFKLAEYYAKDCTEKAAWFETGEKYGREAITYDPNNVGGYYWMAQNLGEHGSISKLYFLNKKSDFEEALKKAEELDNPKEPYDYSGVYRTLAAYYTPRLFWGDLDKALGYAQKMEKSTRYLSNLSVLADLYWKVDKAKGVEYAKRVISADLSQFPETLFENSFEQKETGKNWGKLLK